MNIHNNRGKIIIINGGFSHVPKGQTKGGKVYPTLAECKESF
jgi:hypothetical protein